MYRGHGGCCTLSCVLSYMFRQLVCNLLSVFLVVLLNTLEDECASLSLALKILHVFLYSLRQVQLTHGFPGLKHVHQMVDLVEVIVHLQHFSSRTIAIDLGRLLLEMLGKDMVVSKSVRIHGIEQINAVIQGYECQIWCHIVPKLAQQSLLSVVKLRNAGCSVIFEDDCYIVMYNRKIVMYGTKCPKTGFCGWYLCT